jgi:hypothetical protein
LRPAPQVQCPDYRESGREDHEQAAATQESPSLLFFKDLLDDLVKSTQDNRSFDELKVK